MHFCPSQKEGKLKESKFQKQGKDYQIAPHSMCLLNCTLKRYVISSSELTRSMIIYHTFILVIVLERNSEGG